MIGPARQAYSAKAKVLAQFGCDRFHAGRTSPCPGLDPEYPVLRVKKKPRRTGA